MTQDPNHEYVIVLVRRPSGLGKPMALMFPKSEYDESKKLFQIASEEKIIKLEMDNA